MSGLLGLLHQIGRDHALSAIQTAEGRVVSYNPEEGTVVVELLPEGVQTGDIPFLTPWAGTPGTASGFQFGPSPGLQVTVLAFDTEWEHLKALPSQFSEVNRPPGTPEGEAWLVLEDEETGVKLKKSGHADVSAKTAARIQAPLIQLSDTLDALTDDDAVVRKKDLKAVVEVLNALIDAYKAHKHVGNMGAPTPLDPADIAAAPQPATAKGSSVARAKE